MSLKPLYLVIIITVNFLTACTGNNSVEKLFAPDSKLIEKSEKPVNNSTNINNNTPKIPVTNVKLPDNFPAEIPTYSSGKLVATEKGKTQDELITYWTTKDNINKVFDFYKTGLKDWNIKNIDNKLIADKNNLIVEIALVSETPETKFFLKYNLKNIAQQPEIKTPENVNNSTTETEEKPPLETNNTPNLSENNDSLQTYIQDFQALGIVENVDINKGITRREFARLLFKVNNILYQDTPGKQLRLATETSAPVFTDINKNDPDFAIIQGLVEAGIIPSKLTNDLAITTFNPDSNLTREDMILWKIPLDFRQGFPPSSLEKINETWGFQDTAKINPKILAALLVDFQNGEQSNIKRVFGFTTIFQPKKPVTYSEAMACLWYFGYQNDGKSINNK